MTGLSSSMAAALRIVVLVAVAAAVVDPGCVRLQRAAVEIVAGPSVGDEARRALERRLAGDGLRVGTGEGPTALRVGVGSPRELVTMARTAAPPHVVVRPARPRPHVVALAAPASAVEGLATVLRVEVGDAIGEATMVIVQDGRTGQVIARAPVDVPASAESDATTRVEVALVPTAPGPWPLCVFVEPEQSADTAGSITAASARSASDAGCEPTTLDVAPATVHVDVFEARPSWAARFARLALQRWEHAVVSSDVRVAPGISVDGRPAPSSASTAPSASSEAGTRPLVTVVAGLEALTAADVRRLAREVAEEGRIVILLADAVIPSGRLGDLWPVPTGALRTRATPAPVELGRRRWLASQWLEAGIPSTEIAVLAYLEAARPVPAVLTRAMGKGRVVLVGALDVWRWRGEAPDAHDAAWHALVLSLAALHRRPTPAVWRLDGGGLDEVHVALPDDDGAGATPPSIGVDAHRVTMMRAADGWRGVVAVPSDARPMLQVAGAGGAESADVVGPVRGAVEPPAGWIDVAREVRASGGQVVAEDAVPATLQALGRERQAAGPPWFVTRQWWYAAAVIAALGIEWWSRRRAFAR